MDNIMGQPDESILVCVYYGPNGERLIRRGGKLAKLLKCPLYILTVDAKPYDELDVEKTGYIDQWKQMAEEYGATEFIIKTDEKRSATKVIAEVAREKHITQIILGQTAKSRWEEIAKGSIINILLREIPFIDLHIISVSRRLNSEENHFEKGVRAYLIQEDEKYRLCFNHAKGTIYEGLFFKEIGTDFNNGVFKFMKDGETLHVQVIDDYVTSLTNISITDSLKSSSESEEDL